MEDTHKTHNVLTWNGFQESYNTLVWLVFEQHFTEKNFGNIKYGSPASIIKK